MAYYGNYGGYYPQQQNSLAALEAQLQQLRAMQSPIQNQPLPPTNGVLQVGTYVVVKTLQDMENYGVPVDGTPVNIFIENSGVFYSKKMNKGITTCQPFTFSPLNVNKQVETPPAIRAATLAFLINSSFPRKAFVICPQTNDRQTNCDYVTIFGWK